PFQRFVRSSCRRSSTDSSWRSSETGGWICRSLSTGHWAVINRDAGVVRKKGRALNVRWSVIDFGPAADPGFRPDGSNRGFRFVRHEFTLVIERVKMPAKLQLFKIIHALDRLRADFRFAERGKQQAGQNGNDGNHHEQFDQRESLSNRLAEYGSS